MLDEQRQLIESLKANLHRLLRWQFGPRSEHIDVDQLGLFADGSVVIEVPAPPASEHEHSAAHAPRGERRRAVRVLKNLPRVKSCKANQVNPLTYLTYILSNARNKSFTLPTPDEFTASNIAPEFCTGLERDRRVVVSAALH